jgi:putative ubiquitin-RnfH superfamily antitoxin RatB of RatAB toxin-antitoxin module
MSDTASPHTLNPHTENPYMDEPVTEKAAQLNTNINKSFINQNTESLSIHQSIPPEQASYPQQQHPKEPIDRIDTIEIYREIIMENIEYDSLCENNQYRADEIGEIVELMLETVCTTRKVIRIAGEDRPVELVRSRLLKLESPHIEYVMDCMSKNTTDVRNIKSYLLSALFNAPATIGNYYKSLVNHNMYGS